MQPAASLASVRAIQTVSGSTPVYNFVMNFKFTYAPKTAENPTGATTATSSTSTAGTAKP